MPLEAQTVDPPNLTVRVAGARNANRKVRVALFRGSYDFPTDSSQAFHTKAADIDARTLSLQVVFVDVPVGVYAVSVFPDESMNGKLDKSFIEIPKGYGASNNPKKKMSTPISTKPSFS